MLDEEKTQNLQIKWVKTLVLGNLESLKRVL